MIFATARRNSARILLALLCATGIAGSVTVVTESSAQAATPACNGVSASGYFKVYSGQPSCIVPNSHKCMQVGSASDNGQETANECADISVLDSGSTTDIWGTGEFYCQGVSLKCDEIDVTVGISATPTSDPLAAASTAYSSEYVCTSGCPNGGRAMVSTTHLHGMGPNACYWIYSWDPTGEKFIDGAGASHTSSTELDSNYGQNFELCLQ